MSICKCGKILKFKDNSIETKNGKYGEVYPLYYCDKCNKIYNAEELDCNGYYIEELNKKYLKWFKV